ncbi:MAG TPA: ATP-binding protein [Prolixibacteraceae bacterium]|nr:ATP-binding protein [Prolixibacteraceae bacterium]
MNILQKIKPKSWFTPALMLLGFVFVFGFLIWLIQIRLHRLTHEEMTTDSKAVTEMVRMRLTANEDYLLMIAKDVAVNSLDHSQFQLRASRYVESHPEMINITWIDSSFVIQDVAPLESNLQILGLSIDLEEPRKASRRAKQLRQPQYTNVFEAIQGDASFEIWVPVFEGNTFRGLLAGVYSCDHLINHVVPQQIRERYGIAILDGNGNAVWQPDINLQTLPETEADTLIATTDSQLIVSFSRLGWGLMDKTMWMIMLFCVLLVVGMAYSMWTNKAETKRRIKTEEALNRQNIEFAMLNAEYKIQNLELHQAKEKAESADRLKSAFLANVSHEIRTPLNSIVGFSSLLGEKELDDETRNMYMELVESNTESLLVLIDEILDLSKIEAQQLTLKKADFSMDELIAELYHIFTNGKSRAGVEIRIGHTIEGQNLSIFSDRLRVKQVFVNLLSNANKFTDSGFIELGYFLTADKEVVLYVKDTGSGIKKEYHKEIFQRFRKLNEDSTRLYGGTGLGLAISQKIVELLGGRIWVESEPGRGSTFFFTLQDCTLKTANA